MNNYALYKELDNIMLIDYEECRLQISDRAIACPHCENPIKNNPVKRISKPKVKQILIFYHRNKKGWSRWLWNQLKTGHGIDDTTKKIVPLEILN